MAGSRASGSGIWPSSDPPSSPGTRGAGEAPSNNQSKENGAPTYLASAEREYPRQNRRAGPDKDPHSPHKGRVGEAHMVDVARSQQAQGEHCVKLAIAHKQRQVRHLHKIERQVSCKVARKRSAAQEKKEGRQKKVPARSAQRMSLEPRRQPRGRRQTPDLAWTSPPTREQKRRFNLLLLLWGSLHKQAKVSAVVRGAVQTAVGSTKAVLVEEKRGSDLEPRFLCDSLSRGCPEVS